MTESKPRGLAALSPERRSEVMAKMAATRTANKLAKIARQTKIIASVQAPPDPPANYGRLPEYGRGGAIDSASRDLGGLGEQALSQGRPLAPDIVGLEPGSRSPVRPAKSVDELPFSTTRGNHKEKVKSSPIVYPENDVPGTTLRLPDWETCSIEEANEMLTVLRQTFESAAKSVQNRLNQVRADEGYRCETCGKEIQDMRMAKMIQAVRNPETMEIYNIVWCSSNCFLRHVEGGRSRDK